MVEGDQNVETTNLSDILVIAEQFFQCLHQSKTTIKNKNKNKNKNKTFFQRSLSVSCLGEIHVTPREQPCSVEKGLSHEIPREYIKPSKRVQLSTNRKGTVVLH